ncbi:hypothetical protein [Marinifilum sp. D737]|uniref:hypothetical protein n=1 Tax=Marinifilum sp. D737 TaxID=2969628 RepID=UPI002276043D|nr:hypothetical protein [Marinifilum sp. D737]MCY1635870.1 hypothetical protein [Marinifilum sp. D737]
MKKLLHSLLICLGILMISSQVFAQNADGEKLRPFVGNTYTYTFSGITDGLDYEFYISTSNIGIGAVNAGLTGYITSSTTGTVGTDTPSGTAVATVEWPTTATVNTEVYLFVKISGTGVCENYNAVGITPINNNFTLQLADSDLDGTSCPDLTGLQAVVAPTTNPAYVYNAGKSTLTFTFEKAGNDNDWDLDFNIVQVGSGDYTYTFNGSDVDVTTNNGTTSVSVDDLSGNTKTLTIVVNNVPGEIPTFTITPTSVVDALTNVTPENLPSAVTHTIEKMPVIGTFN